MARSSSPLLVLAVAAAVLACVDAARVAGDEPYSPHYKPDYKPDYRPDYYGHNYQGRPGYSYQDPSTYFDEYDDEDIVRVNLIANPVFLVGMPVPKNSRTPPPAQAPATTGKAASADKSTGAGQAVGAKGIVPDQIFKSVFWMKLSCDAPSEPYGYSKSKFPSAAVPVEFPSVGVFNALAQSVGPSELLTNPLGFYKLWGQVAVKTATLLNFNIQLESTASACDSHLEGITSIVAEDYAISLYSLIVRPQWTLDPRHFINYFVGVSNSNGKRSIPQGTKAADGIKGDDCDCSFATVLHGPVTLMNGNDIVTNGTLTIVVDVGYATDELYLVNPNPEFPDPFQNPLLGLAVHDAINAYKGLKNICSKYHDSIPTVVPELMHLEFPRTVRN